MTRIKYCGLFRNEDIEAANRIRPDFIGFILANKGHRRINTEKARELKALLDPSIQAVGVFINEDPQRIAALVKEGVIDVIQLHGNEDNAYIEHLRSLTDRNILIIQAFGVKSRMNLQGIDSSKADLVLVDSSDSGSGTCFDWSLLQEIKRPYILAGGIQQENILEALKHRPYGVDISSGIETERKKDPQKMQELAEIIRGIQQEEA